MVLMTCLLGNLLIHAASPHIFAYEEKECIGFHVACLIVNGGVFFLWLIFQILESVLGISITLLLKENSSRWTPNLLDWGLLGARQLKSWQQLSEISWVLSFDQTRSSGYNPDSVLVWIKHGSIMEWVCLTRNYTAIIAVFLRPSEKFPMSKWPS